MWRATLAICVVVAGMTVPAVAQYDAQGRYVPSPMGVPRDPYRSTVPLYSGKPGGAIGTPRLPQAYELQPNVPPKYIPRMPAPQRYDGLPPVAVTLEQCDEGYSRDTGVTVRRFHQICRGLRKK